MNILFVSTSFRGHHLEYCHHYYEYAIHSNDNYTFLVSKDFDQVKNKFDWPFSNRVTFQYIDDKVLSKCIGKKGILGNLMMVYSRCMLIREKCKEHNINRVIASMFFDFFPFLPFFINKDVEFRGIIYKALDCSDYKHTIKDYIYFSFISKFDIYKNVYLLNNKKDADILNFRFHVNKYVALPDPVSVSGNKEDLRKMLHIALHKKVYLHFGGLSIRKGTIDILKAIDEIENKSDLTFIFAGVVDDDCKQDFYQIVESLKDKVQILVFDEFCSYDYISSLCYTCDYILIPYKNDNQSSGCLGYAAFYNKPVIGPSTGLLGYLITTYELGYGLPANFSIEDIAHSFLQIRDIKTNGSPYIQNNSISNFQIIFLS